MVLVVLADQVEQCRVGLPDGNILVLVVDQGGNATVWIVLGVFWLLVLTLVEVEVDGVVCETELLEDNGNFPAIWTTVVSIECEVLGHSDSTIVEQGSRYWTEGKLKRPSALAL